MIWYLSIVMLESHDEISLKCDWRAMISLNNYLDEYILHTSHIAFFSQSILLAIHFLFIPFTHQGDKGRRGAVATNPKIFEIQFFHTKLKCSQSDFRFVFPFWTCQINVNVKNSTSLASVKTIIPGDPLYIIIHLLQNLALVWN